jgi:Uma2 family endonuclease
VWVVDPNERAVHVFQPDKPPRKLMTGDVLTNEQVLPGFSEPVGKLFEGI